MDYRSVESLVKELYDAACEARNWSIVRHTSGASQDREKESKGIASIPFRWLKC